MAVPMMNVGIVGMGVAQRSMHMEMRVRLAAIPVEIVPMPMMDVVDVRMGMLHRRVQMSVLVHLGQMQPDPPCHQNRRHDERRADVLVLQNERQRSSDKRRDGKISTGAGCTELA